MTKTTHTRLYLITRSTVRCTLFMGVMTFLTFIEPIADAIVG